jgi:hypothetical protein
MHFHSFGFWARRRHPGQRDLTGLQVAEFVSEVDLLHSELEKLESSARVSLFVYVFASCCHIRTYCS